MKQHRLALVSFYFIVFTLIVPLAATNGRKGVSIRTSDQVGGRMGIKQCVVLSLLLIETQPLVYRAVVTVNVCGAK